MKYPVNCKECNQLLYGPVKYCPFCGAALISLSTIPDKKILGDLKTEIISLLMQGEYTPTIRSDIRQKGKKIGITEEACDSLLLEVLKENGFSRIDEEFADPLAVAWYSAEKRKLKASTSQQLESTTTKKAPPEQVKPDKVIPQVQEQAARSEKPIPPSHIPPEDHLPHPPKPIFGKMVLALGIVAIIIGGLLYAKRSMMKLPISNKVEQSEENLQPTASNLNTIREKIRKEAERKALVKAKAEEKAQEQLIKQKEKEIIAKFEAKKRRQEQEARRRAIYDYLTKGKQFFRNAKYELCIETMKEVIKRDHSNREAKRYIRMASDQINLIKQAWTHPNFGKSE